MIISLFKFILDDQIKDIILLCICSVVYVIIHYLIFYTRIGEILGKYKYVFYGIVIIDLFTFQYFFKSNIPTIEAPLLDPEQIAQEGGIKTMPEIPVYSVDPKKLSEIEKAPGINNNLRDNESEGSNESDVGNESGVSNESEVNKSEMSNESGVGNDSNVSNKSGVNNEPEN